MFQEGEKNNKSRHQAGRVVDLKRLAEKEDPAPAVFAGVSAEDRRGNFIFAIFRSSFRRKEKSVDFLKHYLLKEKEEQFIDREILKEYLEDSEEEKKVRILKVFWHFTARVARLWWLPLFIIRFVWILFWRVSKMIFWRKGNKEVASKKEAILIKKEAEVPERAERLGEKTENKRAGEPVSRQRSAGAAVFFRAVFSAPKSLWDFITGRSPEDYLYQRVLLEEVAKKRFRPLKYFFSFAAILFVIALPFAILNDWRIIDIGDLRGRVLGASERALGDLQAAAGSAANLDLAGAGRDFRAAKENFQQAREDLSDINDWLFAAGKMIPNSKIRLAAQSKDILAAGEYGASLGNNLSLAAASFAKNDGAALSEMIEEFIHYEEYALEDAKNLNASISKIDPEDLPKEYRDKFSPLKEKSADLEYLLSETLNLARQANIFLGAKSDKRYLFVFENNSEMRASGGFIGSFALVDFSQGKIKNIETPGGGSYDTEGGLKKMVAAPEPLWLVNPLWHFWDANWWPDWKKSAAKISWFYEKSGGPTTDGVVAFTPTVLERILDVIGPIDMTEDYGTVFTGENLWVNLRTIIEKEKAADASTTSYEIAENKPKRVVGDLLQRIMEELPKRLDKDKFTKLAAGLELDLREKQILLNFKDAGLQAEAEKRNWAGRLQETNKDYLSVVNTNIAGGKSDGKMEEAIDHWAEVQSDGSIIDTVTITKTHHGVVDEPFYGVRNVNWMRVYVPEGSELLEASGWRGPDPIYFSFPEEGWDKDTDVLAEEKDAVINADCQNTKIYSESGKTVFANWVMVDPGATVVIRLKYRLPFKLEKPAGAEVKKEKVDLLFDALVKRERPRDRYVYSLLLQKQAGARFTSIKTVLSLPAEFGIVWKYPEELAAGDQDWSYEGKLESDKYLAAVLEKSESGE